MEEQKQKNVWKILAITFGVLLIISWFNLFGTSETQAKANVQAYLDALPIDATAGDVTKDKGLYKVDISVEGQLVEAYVSKDGKMLFTAPIDLTTPPITGSTTQEPVEIPKTETPKVKLFVMSQCPFGTIAEAAIDPILDLLDFDFTLYFIASENQDGTFSSLHGQPEVDGDTRQLCVNKYYPDTYMDYIACVNKNYQSLPWESCLTENNMDINKIKECYTGEEGKALLSENIKESNKYQVTGSPTLIINDVKYQGQRNSEAYKQAICSAFTTTPEDCGEIITTAEAPTPSGSC